MGKKQKADVEQQEPQPAPCATCGDVDCESAHAAEVAQVACQTGDCDRQNRLVIIHADTVLPVHCGGCGKVLHCVHDPEPFEHREGTLNEPVAVSGDRCRVCQTVLRMERQVLPPVDLGSLPVSILEQLIARP